MTQDKADKIKELLKEVHKLMKELNIPDEILEREVSATGNSAHVCIPKKYLGKKVIVILRR